MLLGRFEYSVENNVELSVSDVEVLTLLYQPLIGADAIALYLSLRFMTIHTSYTELCKYMNIEIESLERAFVNLEKYRLLSTYKHKSEDSYIHVILNPLCANDLLSHYVYGLELRKIMGNHQYNVLVIHYKKESFDKTNYKEISERKVFNQHLYDEEDLEAVLTSNNDDVVVNSKFNFDLFLKDASELKFPSILRTADNLNYIAELALFYGIHEERMATLVYRSIDYANMNLVRDRLVDRVRREIVDVDLNINKYDLPNDVFLKSLQNGAAVSDYNKRLLEDLSFKMKLNRQVINFLIEHIMQTQGNKLVKNYVLQVAGTWKAYNIESIEQAQQLIDQINLHTKNKYLDDGKKDIVIRETEKTKAVISDEEAELMKEKWKKLGEKYGKTEL